MPTMEKGLRKSTTTDRKPDSSPPTAGLATRKEQADTNHQADTNQQTDTNQQADTKEQAADDYAR